MRANSDIVFLFKSLYLLIRKKSENILSSRFATKCGKMCFFHNSLLMKSLYSSTRNTWFHSLHSDFQAYTPDTEETHSYQKQLRSHKMIFYFFFGKTWNVGVSMGWLYFISSCLYVVCVCVPCWAAENGMRSLDEEERLLFALFVYKYINPSTL